LARACCTFNQSVTYHFPWKTEQWGFAAHDHLHLPDMIFAGAEKITTVQEAADLISQQIK